MDDTFEYVEITDPQSNKSFYANIKTGECVWEKPSGLVRLKDPKTQQWWELFDDTSKLPYYFNTETGATEWLRPFDAVIVPLAAIQNSSIGRRVSVAIKRASINTYQPAIQENVRSFGELRNSRIPELSSSINSLVTSNHLQIPSTTPPIQSHINPVHNQYSSRSSPPSNKSSFKVKEAIVSNFEARPEVPGKSLSIAQQKEQSYNSAKSMGISDPVQNLEAAQKMHPMHSLQSLNNDKKEYLNANSSSRKSLPPDLRQTIEQFRIEGYAKKYFSEHRSGMFRRKVPLEQMLHFQKDMLRSPLLILNKSIHKDAIKCFKLIQQIMGDRISHKQSHVECTKNLCDLGILNGVLRDEIYVQVCKQLTENPNQGHYGNSVFRGWQLLCSLSISFPPSKNLENYIKSFIRQNFNSTFPLSSSTFSKDVVNPLNIMARFLYKKMDKICKFGPRGKPMTIAEIERIMGAPFRVSVFGETLEEVLNSQNEVDISVGRPLSDIPRILPFLSDAILNLNGCKTEGIFRVPGDADLVTELRCRIENGNYDLTGVTDPNIPSSLLKLWLRELTDPLVPVEIYDQCIEVGSDESGDPDMVCKRAYGIVNRLPPSNRAVVLFMIRFLKIIGNPANTRITKMTYANIAMVFAPNFLRCPSENPVVIFENTKFEQCFLRILLTRDMP